MTAGTFASRFPGRRMTRHVARFAVVIALVTGCHIAAKPAKPVGGGADPSDLRTPSSFLGNLPCADCPGIRYHLDIWPDHAFHLRREWLEKSNVQVDIGRWRIESNRRVLVLDGPGETLPQFEILAPDTLRLVDPRGNHIVSRLPYNLGSDGTLQAIDVSLPMGGELSVEGDTLHFTECLTGVTYVVTDNGDAPAARQACMKSSRAVYVTVDGTLHPDGHMVVHRFINAWTSQSCARARANAALMNTYWRMDRLGSNMIQVAQIQREPHLILRNDMNGHTYEANAGCNQMLGSYTLDGERIAFAPGRSTLMACAPPFDMLERNLVDALTRAHRWRIIGNTLELLDASGASLALFESVSL